MREALLLLALLATRQPTQEPSLRWEEFHKPVYPQMARIAHIFGRVVLQITVQPDGTVTIQSTAGHPILVQAATDSVQKSKLSCEGCGEQPHTFAVVYEFKIDEPPPPVVVAPVRRAPRSYRVRTIRCMYLWRCALRWN